MKKRIAFALAGILVCVGAASCFTSYTPVPDTAEIADVLVLRVHAGDTSEDITEQADTDAICELLPQIRAPSAELSSRHQRRLLSDSGGIRR